MNVIKKLKCCAILGYSAVNSVGYRLRQIFDLIVFAEMIQQFSVHIWAIGLRDWDLIESASLVLENSLNPISECRWEGEGWGVSSSTTRGKIGNTWKAIFRLWQCWHHQRQRPRCCFFFILRTERRYLNCMLYFGCNSVWRNCWRLSRSDKERVGN